jgi:hypothetical protein
MLDYEIKFETLTPINLIFLFLLKNGATNRLAVSVRISRSFVGNNKDLDRDVRCAGSGSSFASTKWSETSALPIPCVKASRNAGANDGRSPAHLVGITHHYSQRQSQDLHLAR